MKIRGEGTLSRPYYFDLSPTGLELLEGGGGSILRRNNILRPQPIAMNIGGGLNSSSHNI